MTLIIICNRCGKEIDRKNSREESDKIHSITLWTNETPLSTVDYEYCEECFFIIKSKLDEKV